MRNLDYRRSRRRVNRTEAIQILGDQILHQGRLDPQMLEELCLQALDQIVAQNDISHPGNDLKRSVSIFKRYWGLDGNDPCTYREAGVLFGIHASRVRDHVWKIQNRYLWRVLRKLYTERRAVTSVA